MASRWTRLGAVVCLVMLLAGCSSSSKSWPSPPSADALKQIVLHAADLPSTWKASPYEPDPNDASDQAALAKCVGVRNTEPDIVASADSDDYSLGSARIGSSAASYRTQSAVNTDVAMLLAPNASACFGQSLSKQLVASVSAGAKIISVSLKITPGSAGGPPNVQATGKGTVVLSAHGRQATVYLSLAFITGPLVEADVVAASPGSPVPEPLVRSVVRAVATRAARR